MKIEDGQLDFAHRITNASKTQNKHSHLCQFLLTEKISLQNGKKTDLNDTSTSGVSKSNRASNFF